MTQELKDQAYKFINKYQKGGFLLAASSITDDLETKESFSSAINYNVRILLNRIDPYALVIVTGNSGVFLAIVKCQMELTAGGAAVSSYGFTEITSYNNTTIHNLFKFDGENSYTVANDAFKQVLTTIIDSEQNCGAIIELLEKFYNLSNPTFDSEGNQLFADEAENIAERIFEYSKDPVERVLRPLEDDLIARDMRAFENGDLISDNTSIMSYATTNGRKLHVINFNRHIGENAIGVDLLYYLRDFHSIVMLQYKRLDDKRYYVSHDNNYQNELNRMESSKHHFSLPATYPDNLKHKIFRLNDCPFYFKLCPPWTKTTNKIVTGDCIPINQMKAIIDADFCTTPNGNKRIHKNNTRDICLKSTEFISLVKKGLIGGYVPSLERFLKLVHELKYNNHMLVTAIESSQPQ